MDGDRLGMFCVWGLSHEEFGIRTQSGIHASDHFSGTDYFLRYS